MGIVVHFSYLPGGGCCCGLQTRAPGKMAKVRFVKVLRRKLFYWEEGEDSPPGRLYGEGGKELGCFGFFGQKTGALRFIRFFLGGVLGEVFPRWGRGQGKNGELRREDGEEGQKGSRRMGETARGRRKRFALARICSHYGGEVFREGADSVEGSPSPYLSPRRGETTSVNGACVLRIPLIDLGREGL